MPATATSLPASSPLAGWRAALRPTSEAPRAPAFEALHPHTPSLRAAPAAALLRVPLQAFNVSCELVLAAADDAAAMRQAAAAIAELRRIEARYDPANANGVLARINAAAGGEALPCDDETGLLLDQADALHRSSGGLFDATAGVLHRAWNYAVADLPARSELAALLPLIGWHRVERSTAPQRQVRLPQAGMALDFGGFLKEYAADAAAAVLRLAGARHGYIDLGGDLRAIGPRPDGSPWLIAIPDPRCPQRTAATVALSEGGLATSGDARRFIEVGGRRYGNVLDPRTGWPISAWRSVSVQASSALRAGGAALQAVLRQGDGRRYLETTGLPYVAITHDGRLHLKGAVPV